MPKSSNRTGLPLHIQLGSAVRNMIASGEIAPGEVLPTEQALMTRFGVSRTVVRQAMQALEWEGLVSRHPGKGTFVRERPNPSFSGWSIGSLNDLLAFGQQTRLDIIDIGDVAAPANVATALETDAGETVVRLRGLRRNGDSVVSYQCNFFPKPIGDQMARSDFSNGSILEVLEKNSGVAVSEAVQAVSAIAAEPEISSLLGVPEGAPLLQIERLFFAPNSGPIEYGVMLYRPDRYRYISKLLRTDAPRTADDRSRKAFPIAALSAMRPAAIGLDEVPSRSEPRRSRPNRGDEKRK